MITFVLALITLIVFVFIICKQFRGSTLCEEKRGDNITSKQTKKTHTLDHL